MTNRSVLVAGQWLLPLIDGAGGHFKYLDTASQWNEACFLYLIQGLPRGLSYAEYFGGVGIFSTIIRNSLAPTEHYIFDLDRDCARQLKKAFGGCPHVTVARGDARKTLGSVTTDVAVLDFPVCTLRTFDAHWPVAALLQHRPRYLLWSDTALLRIGWFRGLYTQFLTEHGIEKHVVSFTDYVHGFNAYLWAAHGYTITKAVHHRAYAYLLAQPLPAPTLNPPVIKLLWK